MEKLGMVCAVERQYVKVRVQRASACGENCAACGACGGREMMVRIKNTGDLTVGDTVRLTSDDARFLKRTAAGYLSLTLLMIIGGWLGASGGSEWASFAGAAVALCAGIFLLRRFFSTDIDIKVEKIKR